MSIVSNSVFIELYAVNLILSIVFEDQYDIYNYNYLNKKLNMMRLKLCINIRLYYEVFNETKHILFIRNIIRNIITEYTHL